MFGINTRLAFFPYVKLDLNSMVWCDPTFGVIKPRGKETAPLLLISASDMR